MARMIEYMIRYKTPTGKLGKMRTVAESKGMALSNFHATNKRFTIISIVVYKQSGRQKNGV
jgi:hypothetical protein